MTIHSVTTPAGTKIESDSPTATNREGIPSPFGYSIQVDGATYWSASPLYIV